MTSPRANAWQKHLCAHRASHPKQTWQQSVKNASKTYRSSKESDPPFSKMKCNRPEARKRAIDVIQRGCQFIDSIKIGTRKATTDQKAAFKTGGKITMQPVKDANFHNNEWKMMKDDKWTGFVWNFSDAKLHYTTQDGKTFPVEIPDPKGLTIAWETSCCAKCKACPPQLQTWHGACLKCENPGCFCPGGTVLTIDGTEKLIENLNVGDVVQTECGFNSICEVRKGIADEKYVCDVRGLTLTHKHPVKLDGEWCYPKHIAFESRRLYSGPIVNFVMNGEPEEKSKHTIVVGGVVCATLGNGPDAIANIDSRANSVWGSGFWNTVG